MLLPWSKPSCLSLSAQGIALRLGNQVPQLLSDQAVVGHDDSALAKVLEQQATLLKHQTIEVVLSNALVRYCVLPWQNGIYRREDWEAIAQHAFRKDFGSEANEWVVTLSLAAYQAPVLAGAIDQSLLLQLQTLSKQIGFTLAGVTPLLAKLEAKQTASSTQWLCAAEPQRIVLLQKNKEGYQQVLVDSPPTNAESMHLQQLVSRALLQTQQASAAMGQVSKPLVYVSNALKTSWDDTVASSCKLAMPLTASQPHPVWMAGL